MSVSLPNGALVAVASGYGASKEIVSLSNGNPANAELEASHGIINGDFIEVTSGWSRLTDKIVRASSVGSPTANFIELEGIDTTLTSIYPSGGGTG